MLSFGRPKVLDKCLKILRLSFVNFTSVHDLKNLNVIRTVEKILDDKTSIFVESPIHVRVQPIDVNDLLAHNKLTMTLYGRGKETSDFQVKQTSKRLELLNKNTEADKNDVCVIQVPYHLNVSVTTTENASVQLSKLEADEFTVKTDKGETSFSDMKAKSIKIESNQGDIESHGRIQSTLIDLKTGFSAAIKCHSVMANVFNATTHDGPISVKSCYADNSHFTTLTGDIRLDHLHRSVLIDVIQHGNLYILSFAGNLQASLKSGEVYMLASQLTDKSSIFIHEKGKVEVLIQDILKNLPATNLIADKISVDAKIMKLGKMMDDSHPMRFRFEKEPQNELHIVCKNGSIDLKETNVPFTIGQALISSDKL